MTPARPTPGWGFRAFKWGFTMTSTRHTQPARAELVNISRRLKIPLKHLLEYVRFLNGHPTTKLRPDTKRYINDKMSLPKFRAMEDAIDRSKP